MGFNLFKWLVLICLIMACGDQATTPVSGNLNEQLARGELAPAMVAQIAIICTDEKVSPSDPHAADAYPSVTLDAPTEVMRLFNELADGAMNPSTSSTTFQRGRVIASLTNGQQVYFDYKIMEYQHSSEFTIPHPDPQMPSLDLRRGGMKNLAQWTQKACEKGK